MIFDRGSANWRAKQQIVDSATCFASKVARSAADRATAVVRTRRAPFNGIATKSQTAIQGVNMNSYLLYTGSIKFQLHKAHKFFVCTMQDTFARARTRPRKAEPSR